MKANLLSTKAKRVLRFRVTLQDIDPPIWRLIDVPENYTFWDLHVAIQDSMGWLDYHLHQFTGPERRGGPAWTIGIPDDEFMEGTIPGWEVPLTDRFTEIGQTFPYEYDFGDGWSHRVTLEGILLREKRRKYPVCIDGARACPPEDCGGLPGYEELLEVLRSTSHPEYESMVDWLKGHAKNYWPYEPEAFNPASVKFDNPKRRLKQAFDES